MSAEVFDADRARREHRRLDDLFGRFLAASAAGETSAARAAFEEFDEDLRRHTAEEERHLPGSADGKLFAPSAEDPLARLGRELRLEHVQIRELSGMIRRLLDEKGDLEGARRLAGSLARRWDAHTQREEEHAFPDRSS